ncbi:COX15/CtaA family protein [Sanguibacter sp. A247]|uniref:COX15/CtaA family protein n=1 Tax=unclassified Sanguibacter TaxID=2645534 RepID=UPI003FD7CDB6
MTTPAPTTDSRPTLASPTRLRRILAWVDSHRRGILVANLVTQIGIIVSGGLVRLTGSGLGCSTWPQCEPGRFTPVYHPEATYHSAIEFGNRTLTFVLCISAGLAALAVWRMRDRSPGFRRLGLWPIIGVLVQAVVGGITVLVDLHPAIVGSHMVISLGLVAVSTYLLVRFSEGDGPVRLVVPRAVRTVAIITGWLAVPMLVLGVVTTGAGPHSGDTTVGYRFAIDPAHAAKLHGLSVWVYVAAVVVVALLVVWGARSLAEGAAVRRALGEVGAMILAQAGIGYLQFFTGLPVVLVLAHMLGAALTTVVVVRLVLATRTRDDVRAQIPAPARDAV